MFMKIYEKKNNFVDVKLQSEPKRPYTYLSGSAVDRCYARSPLASCAAFEAE